MGPTARHNQFVEAGRRRGSRLRTRLAARLVTLDGTYQSLLLDLSQTGARVKAAPELRAGAMAVLSWARFEAFGTIVWVDGGQAGMEFDHPLNSAVLYATRDAEQLPADRELARTAVRDWVQGVRRC